MHYQSMYLKAIEDKEFTDYIKFLKPFIHIKSNKQACFVSVPGN